ncbi:hypothetical protein PENARI_c008G05275 [Penicillium arizonense]|uniref:NmrA-like domain-containing protein n=1 Tax=Penicillium arizonense TaxID=1835702 RepID=A0A1F5LK11_PENAI|nr:hypothetical protein PENARI_c008G05275 [Penicillium arizonense]OGE53436.1 hypothetical protein PENARI_c008G05275 [Penicillium arizonense]
MVPKIVLITGATGTQGGAVARILLQHPDQYIVRCLTRNPESDKAQALETLGAVPVRGDLTVPSSLSVPLKGAWGVFGVTDFYDTNILDDPLSEEQQGRNLAKAAAEAGVECFLWSTLPSSSEISGGQFITQLYEGKHNVDAYIRQIGLPGVFIFTGNFYENMITRKYVSYDPHTDKITMRRPILKPDASITTLYVEKDLGAVCKAVWDQWDDKKNGLDGKYLLAAGAHETPRYMAQVLEKVSGKKVEYSTLPTTGIPERDIMLNLYNAVGMHPNRTLPTEEIQALGLNLHTVDSYYRQRLLPHLGLPSVN